ncbi:hypothetical protein V6N13_013298 [Hibiscus sabdariffa]
MNTPSMGGSHSLKPSRYFQDLVYDISLGDMRFNGSEYTWRQGFTQERLERFLCNSFWDESYSESTVQHLIRIQSDHRPILLQVGASANGFFISPFRYLSSWSSHNDFNHMVADNWIPSSTLSEMIISFMKATNTWNKTVYGYIGAKKRIVMARLRGVQKSLCTKSSRFLSTLESDLLVELENILDQEELLWRQKSRSNWDYLG